MTWQKAWWFRRSRNVLPSNVTAPLWAFGVGALEMERVVSGREVKDCGSVTPSLKWNHNISYVLKQDCSVNDYTIICTKRAAYNLQCSVSTVDSYLVSFSYDDVLSLPIFQTQPGQVQTTRSGRWEIPLVTRTSHYSPHWTTSPPGRTLFKNNLDFCGLGLIIFLYS